MIIGLIARLRVPWFVPQGLDVERMLYLYDAGRYGEARSLLAAVFSLACGRL